MNIQGVVAAASSYLMYFVQVGAAYLALRGLCGLVPNSQVRFWLWSVFLGGTIVAWFHLLLVTNVLGGPAWVLNSFALPIVSETHFSWAVNSAWMPHLAAILSYARWVYLVVLSLLLLQFSSRFWQLRSLFRASRQPVDAVAFLFEIIRSESNAPRCELRLLPGLRSPGASGWLRPKVLFPEELLTRLEPKQLSHILRHELVHVRRRDYLWDRLATLGCCLVFFHPAVWFARRRLRWERELICDEGVIERARETRFEYASCLTSLARWWFLLDDTAETVDFTSSPSQIATRVHALLRQTGPWPGSAKVAMGVFAIVALGFVLWLVPDIAVRLYWPVIGDAGRNHTGHAIPKWSHGGRVAGRRKSQRSRKLNVATSLGSESRSIPETTSAVAPLPHFAEPKASESAADPGLSGEVNTESPGRPSVG